MSCDNNNIEPKTKHDNIIKTTENFDWLIGKWKRNNDEDGRVTFESWHKISRKEYKGFGYAISENDTISKETMTITNIKGGWELRVITKNEETPTKFSITKIDKFSSICENKEIDFPNKIHYWEEGKILKAKVSSSDLEINFEFDRIREGITTIPTIPSIPRNK